MERTFDDVWAICTANNRAIPRSWDKLFNMLKNKKQNSNGGFTPSAPLILAAWSYSTPIEKHLRLKEHIQWAFEQNQMEEVGFYLESLAEEDWYHFGEL